MLVLVSLIGVALIVYMLANYRPNLFTFMLAAAGFLSVLGIMGGATGAGAMFIWLLLIAGSVIFAIPAIRKKLISASLLKYVKSALPPMSETERTAIEAGTVWWEAELFKGSPDYSKLLSVEQAQCSAEEQQFIDGPTHELCSMLDDWEITHELNDLPESVWQFMKDNRFFGIVIPKEYGGLGFSAIAHSMIISKISTRSVTAGVTVMVPNSLGPGELLQHYGTQEQKDYYLPRLAIGTDIPCFALTSPTAGSDAASITDYGIVCKGMHDGEEVLGLRLNWDKRYITLGPIATVLGLAFKAYDPDGLLGDQEDIGITCALIPTKTEGVTIGRRHLPLNQSFMNGPNQGKDVFIPLDWVIGGPEMMGQGWRMLMESLSVGRGISLPSNGVASGKFVSRITGAYASIRYQFNTAIGKFEGVEEALTRIAATTYMMDAASRLTCAALDQGEKPSVVSAILKYHNTEGLRSVLNDAMDVHGGKGICMGPSNSIARAYQSIPIGITVEGANILTRSLIIFGQGSMRCHPWLVKEIQAASMDDKQASLDAFDEALSHHISYAVGNGAKALFHGITQGHFIEAPIKGDMAKYYQRLSHMSAAYAFLADFTLLVLGGGLKRREKLSGRFADAMTYMYVCSAVLKRFEDTGRPEEDKPLLEWSVRYCLYQVQIALDQILRNFPNLWIGLLIRVFVFPLGRRYRTPNDGLGRKVAKLLLKPSLARDRLTEGVYINEDPDDVVGRVEYALQSVIAAEAAEKKCRKYKLKCAPGQDYEAWLSELVKRHIIQPGEAALLQDAHEAIAKVIAVDDFPIDEK